MPRLQSPVSASAPGRCGIVGNPSDIYGGFVVSCSVPDRAVCRLEPVAEDVLPEDRLLWDAATARYPASGVRVMWETAIPRSQGLSGSTALLAATLVCLRSVHGNPPDLGSVEGRTAFGEELRDVECVQAGIVGGYQDSQMIAHGGLQAMDFAGKHPAHPGPPPRVTALEPPSLPFLLVSTGVERLSGSVHGPIRERWLRGDREVVDRMNRVTELGRLGARALQNGDWPALGEAMTENHALVAALGGSGEAIDALIAACRAEGAVAAKLAGAGLGGTVIALTENPEDLEARLRRRGYARFLRPALVPGVTASS
ncbi:MAG: hypothetical protein KIS66_11180 [Fimbriimonadaceae bacterium]|nr:hypothetical protein [Fimbriimonadaceae bacterium]